MRNIKLKIEYDGTNYCGWQRQIVDCGVRNAERKSIQGTIEKALYKALVEKVRLVASGRTDSGVHAKGQVANFKTKSSLPVIAIMRALNANLPDDIVIKGAEEMPLSFNARFDAKSKVYRYTILNRPQPAALNRQYLCHLPHPLDVWILKREARALIGRKDFKSFHSQGRRPKDFVRHIKRLDVKKDKDGFIYIDIEANGFLYNMVRNIVGTLIEVARGKLPPNSTRRILEGKDRKLAGPTAKACGLCLEEVRYQGD